MKTIFILLLLLSCSKSVTTGTKTVVNQPNPNPNTPAPTTVVTNSYMVISENEAVDYSSQNIRIAEVIGDELFYTIGLMNNYQKDKNGQNRSGTHPETEFRIQTARFKMIPVGDKVRLEFLMSSCGDSSRNPFVGIIPATEISITQLVDKISIKQSDTEEDVLFKAEASEIEPLWDSNVSRILCGDETND